MPAKDLIAGLFWQFPADHGWMRKGDSETRSCFRPLAMEKAVPPAEFISLLRDYPIAKFVSL
jgi:hypothetical protein